MSVTVVVPAYNEEGSIHELLGLIENLSAKSNLQVSLTFIENGSLDSTQESIEKELRLYPDLDAQVVLLNSNIGYGGAMKLGVEKAQSENVLLIPADGKYSLEDILAVCAEYFSKKDLRLMVKGERVIRNDPRSVQYLSKTLTWITNFLFRTSLRDVNGLPKILNRNLISDQLAFLPNDACFDVGLVALWRKNGGITSEIPVLFTQKNLTNTSWAGKRLKVSSRMLAGIFRVYLRSRNWKI